ncbi:MAG: ABC transporter substrate-binding protein [Candidatus Rokuibacteriota bacterium]
MSGALLAFGVVVLALFTTPLAAGAQGAASSPRIGILRSGSPPDPLVEAFRQGLRELGYVEGRNISVEYRWAKGRSERLGDLAAELVRLRMDVIVVAGNEATRVVKHATSTIPIVMPVSIDPVGSGLVASLPRPGGNVTGLALLAEELPGKWMELLKEVLPRASRMAAIWHSAGDPGQVRTSEAAARSLGLRLHVLTVGRPEDFGRAFAEAQANRAEGLVVLPSGFFFAHRARILELAASHRLPAIYDQEEWVVGSGGLISYGPNIRDLFRRAASFADRILKGARPADLPVEQPTKFDLVINLRTAKALGLTVPPSLLARADEVIQ